MKNKKQILVNFLIRVICGFAIIFCVNQFLAWKEIQINVGFNVISFLVSGLLGVPGVAMLYGVVACPFL
jgi:inhibitor of the pro-sigma K processing machinery